MSKSPAEDGFKQPKGVGIVKITEEDVRVAEPAEYPALVGMSFFYRGRLLMVSDYGYVESKGEFDAAVEWAKHHYRFLVDRHNKRAGVSKPAEILWLEGEKDI
ncbi:MAG: hypothetical protein QXE96_02225 [Candidatus Caldarchaeum sp.]